ncbi:MAG: hypothetical protein JWP08_3484, partial [Bryobacterales bacterium]|nr:hypothetical protein [Bryobacterales bacterium]
MESIGRASTGRCRADQAAAATATAMIEIAIFLVGRDEARDSLSSGLDAGLAAAEILILAAI